MSGFPSNLSTLASTDRDYIASLIDHAILHPTLSDSEILAELERIKKYPIASVCIKPYAVKIAVESLAGTSIKVGTVIGFPHGSSSIQIKASETTQAFRDGASEVDMVVNVGKVLSENWSYIEEEISSVLSVSNENGGLLKVIFETDYLPDDYHKIRLCEICSNLKVGFVKTSTGFGFVKRADGSLSTLGATDHDLKLMRNHSAPEVGVKASGGIRTLEDVRRVVALGVTRVGTSSTEAILASDSDSRKMRAIEFEFY